MDYAKQVNYVGQRAFEMGATICAGAGLLAGVYVAVTNQSLQSEGSIAVGYGLMGMGVQGAITGGIIGAAVGPGLEAVIRKIIPTTTRC